MTGQIPDPTVDSDAELDLPPPPPVRIMGLLISMIAALLGLIVAGAVPFWLSGLPGDLHGGWPGGLPESWWSGARPWFGLLSVLMLSAGPVATVCLLRRRGVCRRWREVAFGCGDELTQSVARIASITLMILFTGGITVLSAEAGPARAEAAMLVLQGGSLAAWGLMFDLLWRGRPCRIRRMCGVAADTLCITLLLCVGDPSTQVWMFAYIWIALGSALSDGAPGAIAAAAAGVLGLAVVALTTGVLSEAPYLIIGVASGLILLPAQAGGLIGGAAARSGGTSKRRFRVLLAEDSDYGGRSLRRQLERAGHTVHIAGNGDSALDLLHKGGLDVMLIDLHLRNPSALDIVRMYRFMRSEDANLPIVGLAPGLDDPMRKRCVSAGMNEVLPMPVEGFRLLEAVDRLGAASFSARQALETGVIASISSHPRFSAVAEPSIDEAALDALQSLDPDNGFLEDVISVFLIDGAELIDAMCQALNEGDVLTFREHADSLGSSSTHIGAIRLVKLLARCRDMPTRGFKEEGNQRMLQIQEEFRRVRTALQSHVWALRHSGFN
jgi:CheY-like chemotaxis protein